MRIYQFEQLVFTADDGRLRRANDEPGETLRPQAATLLQYLLEHAGEVVPRDALFEAVWGPDAVVDFEAGLAALIRELRQTLKAVGARDNLIETVPRRGYRFTGELQGEQSVPPPGQPRPWRRVVLGALGAAAAALGLTYWLLFAASPADSPQDHRLAILPFETYQPVEAMPEHVGLLMADTLLAEMLTRPSEGLELIGRTSLRPYVDRDDVVAAVAEDLGVELLVEGAVSGQADGGWLAELRLLSVPPGEVVWSTTIRGEAGQRMDVRSAAAGMAEALAAAWPQMRQSLQERRAGH